VFVKIAPKSLEPLGLTRNVALTDETLTNGAKESTISRTLSDKDENSKTTSNSSERRSLKLRLIQLFLISPFSLSVYFVPSFVFMMTFPEK
jgi:uncharacterized protein YqhQ